MASKLIKPRQIADTPGQKRRGVLSTFYDPRPLKLRKLDPNAVEKFKENSIRVLMFVLERWLPMLLIWDLWILSLLKDLSYKSKWKILI